MLRSSPASLQADGRQASLKEVVELLLGDDGDAQGLGLRGLRARARSSDHERGLLRDRARRLSSARGDCLLGASRSYPGIAPETTMVRPASTSEAGSGASSAMRTPARAHASSTSRCQSTVNQSRRERPISSPTPSTAESSSTEAARRASIDRNFSASARPPSGRRGGWTGRQGRAQGAGLLGLVQLGEHLLGALGGAGLDGLEDGLSAQLAGLVGLGPEVANLLPVPCFLALLLDGLPRQ